MKIHFIGWSPNLQATGCLYKLSHALHALFSLRVLQCRLRLNDQPKLRGSGVVVTLVCEYTRDPEGI